MLNNLTEKIQSSQNKFEELVAKIPGYAGYKQREQRREADKLLRLHVARQYEPLIDRLNRLQYELVEQGDLSSMFLLERAATRLQLLVDRLRTASYGYAGLFDAIKVDQDVLDRLYDFDQGMLSGVETLTTLFDTLEKAIMAGEAIQETVKALNAELDRLHHVWSERQEVILG